MGKRDRERIERIQAGVEKPVSDVSRERIVNAGINTVQRYSINNQVRFLADSLHTGKLSADKLKKALEDNAHKEMRKGYDKLSKGGKSVTIEMLLDEYNKDIDFQNLASEVGLDRQWFTDLAEAEIASRIGHGQGEAV